MKKIIFLTPGKKYGELTFIKELATLKNYERRGLFSCSCGKEVNTSIFQVKAGLSKRCYACRGIQCGKTHTKNSLKRLKARIGEQVGTRVITGVNFRESYSRHSGHFSFAIQCVACKKKSNAYVHQFNRKHECRCQKTFKGIKRVELDECEHAFVARFTPAMQAKMSFAEYKAKAYASWKALYPSNAYWHGGKYHAKPKYNYMIDGVEYVRPDLVNMLGLTRERIRQLDVAGLLEGRVRAHMAGQ